MTSFVFVLSASLALAQAPELPGWKLVWSDEFNYTGHPDPTKWRYEEGYERHNQYYAVNRLEHDGGLCARLSEDPRRVQVSERPCSEINQYTEEPCRY